MAKRQIHDLVNDTKDGLPYDVWRTQIVHRLSLLAVEQERLRVLLSALEGPVLVSPVSNGNSRPSGTPLVPEPGPERIPKPARRSWSPEAREAQRKRMKAFHRKRKASQHA